ncbi:MAG: PAS domain-containing sensor histidine kinase [Imperialibacter sp.]|uniref:PAS domain-containing sensor histidine kinase n=1 Tax=Imperialibacter sp. TaxID=2038411 RepID=UPI0032EB62D5
MTDKPTRLELENQVAELKRQNEILRLQLSSQNQQKKRQKESLVERNSVADAYIRTILDNMGDSVFIKDDQSRLVLVNDAFCEMFGLPREEIMGNTLAEHVPHEERESFLKIDRQVLADGKENINEETLTVRGAETMIISTRKSRYVDASGKRFLVGVVRDITASKKAGQALKKSEMRLRELNATKDKLFSIMGHDLRAPLNNILGLSELLIEPVKKSKTAKSEEYLALVIASVKNTLTLLDNLLNWAKSQTGEISYKPEKIDLPSVIRQVIELSGPIAKAKNISLRQTASEEIEAYTDERMLKTVLRNLISNAVKFTKPGGSISVSVMLEQNEVQFSVADNGLGIKDADSKKLFDMSTNTSSPGTENEKGSGLGLVLCKEFVTKLGGDIWLESREGDGSDFKFTLPMIR